MPRQFNEGDGLTERLTEMILTRLEGRIYLEDNKLDFLLLF